MPRRLLITSVVARLPLAVLGIVLLIHAEGLTGSFATAGTVSAAYAIALGVGGPLLGRLVDRRGQTAVLIASAAVEAGLLAALALVPHGAPPAALAALAAGVGLSTPPVGACLRALLPELVTGRDALRAIYALEASAVELTWVFGPPLALAVAAVWSTAVALLVSGAVLLGATLAFALQPASRAWRPLNEQRVRGGSLRIPALRTLVLVMVAVGVLFGACEVAVTAAGDTAGGPAAAAPLLGLWGIGSVLGGMVASRIRRSLPLPVLLAALALGHGALLAAPGGGAATALVLFLAGSAIAPTYGTLYALVDAAAPAASATEAFAWIATAASIGGAAGSAAAGALSESAGPGAAFALAGVAGAVACLTALAGGTAPAVVAGSQPAVA